MSNESSEGQCAPAVINAMTVDVEDWFQVQAFADVIRRDSWSSREYRVVDNTNRLLALFDDCSVKATFFVLGWIAERSPGLIRDIRSAGHELACHGWSHQLVFNQTPAEFRQETIRAKSLIEDISGVRIDGYRAATYSITRKSLWALDILVDAGFVYDSSVFPIRHDTYGIPEASPWPSLISTPAGKSIFEFPMTTLPIGFARLPVCGGGYFRLLPYWYTARGLSSVNRRCKQAFVFYLHPWEVDPEQPRVNAPWKSRLRHYTGLGSTLSRLGMLTSQFHFGTMREAIERGHPGVLDRSEA